LAIVGSAPAGSITPIPVAVHRVRATYRSAENCEHAVGCYLAAVESSAPATFSLLV
jgi:hypothetical protein